MDIERINALTDLLYAATDFAAAATADRPSTSYSRVACAVSAFVCDELNAYSQRSSVCWPG